MTVALAGMALIPVKEHMKTFITFREQCGEHVTGPHLGTTKNPPHVTILQCPFNLNQLNQTTLKTILHQYSQTHPNQNYTSVYTNLYYQPVGWYFADINMKTWGTVLQTIALNNLETHIHNKAITIDNSYTTMPPLEQHNQKQYGYRYMGEAYRPHITLGITPTSSQVKLPTHIQQLYKESLHNTPVHFDKAVFYIAGQHGAASEIIAELSL